MTGQQKLLAGFVVLLLLFSVLLGHTTITLFRVAKAQDQAADAAWTLDLAGEIRAAIAEMSAADQELHMSYVAGRAFSPLEIRRVHEGMFDRFDHAAPIHREVHRYGHGALPFREGGPQRGRVEAGLSWADQRERAGCRGRRPSSRPPGYVDCQDDRERRRTFEPAPAPTARGG